MSDANDRPGQRCPACDRLMEYVKLFPQDIAGGDGGIIHVSLESHVWRCPEHGLWRIYISGKKVQISEIPDEKTK